MTYTDAIDKLMSSLGLSESFRGYVSRTLARLTDYSGRVDVSTLESVKQYIKNDLFIR